jgi:hypothetical protein
MKVLALSMVLFLVGCGGGSSTNNTVSNPAPTTPSTIQGQWTFTGNDSQDFQVVVFANLAQSANDSFFAAANSVAVCRTGQGIPPVQAATAAACSITGVPLQGTLSASSVTINLTNVGSVNGGTETVNANGTFTTTNNAVTTMKGSWNSSDGAVPDSGSWTAQPNTPFTGSYSGTVNFNGSVPINVTLTLTQDSKYGITGLVTLNDPCYMGWNFTGNVIGGGFGGFDPTKSIVAGAVQTSSGEITFGYKSVSGCATAGIGVLSTTAPEDGKVKASESQKLLLNSVLNSLASRAKIAEKQKELLRKLLGKA